MAREKRKNHRLALCTSRTRPTTGDSISYISQHIIVFLTIPVACVHTVYSVTFSITYYRYCYFFSKAFIEIIDYLPNRDFCREYTFLTGGWNLRNIRSLHDDWSRLPTNDLWYTIRSYRSDVLTGRTVLAFSVICPRRTAGGFQTHTPTDRGWLSPRPVCQTRTIFSARFRIDRNKWDGYTSKMPLDEWFIKYITRKQDPRTRFNDLIHDFKLRQNTSAVIIFIYFL